MTTKFTQSVKIELDAGWTDAILITGFDRQYGACWYWANQETDARKYLEDPNNSDLLVGVALLASDEGDYAFANNTNETVVNAESLSRACERVLNDFNHTETARQLRRALETPDELPDLDAEAADVLIQLAVYDNIVFG